MLCSGHIQSADLIMCILRHSFWFWTREHHVQSSYPIWNILLLVFWVQVLDWPGPIRKGVGPVEGPSINSVTMDTDLQFLVALSDQNMVIVWKRDDGRDGSS